MDVDFNKEASLLKKSGLLTKILSAPLTRISGSSSFQFKGCVSVLSSVRGSRISTRLFCANANAFSIFQIALKCCCASLSVSPLNVKSLITYVL